MICSKERDRERPVRGVAALVNEAFETTVEDGYPQGVACFERLRELKMIVCLM